MSSSVGRERREVGAGVSGSAMPERFREAHSAGDARVGATGERRVIGRTVELVGWRRDGTAFPIELSLSRALAALPSGSGDDGAGDVPLAPAG